MMRIYRLQVFAGCRVKVVSLKLHYVLKDMHHMHIQRFRRLVIGL